MFDESRPLSIHDIEGTPPAEPVKPAEQAKKPDFEDFFMACYGELTHALRENISDDSQVLDIGCGIGSAERKINIMKQGCIITCVDSDPKAIEEMWKLQDSLSENGHGNGLDVIREDANEFLKETTLKNQDTVLMAAVLHEINNINDRKNYLKTLLTQLSAVTALGGKVIIADYYYADGASDEDVARFMAYQQEVIGHADKRERFVKPEELLRAVEGSDFKVLDNQVMRAVQEIERYFYIITLEKEK